MNILVPLECGPEDEFWLGENGARALQKWLSDLERIVGRSVAVAADSHGFELLPPERQAVAIRLDNSSPPQNPWWPRGGRKAVLALINSTPQALEAPLVLINPRLAPLDARIIRDFMKKGRSDESMLATARTQRDHPSQMRINVLIEDVGFIHLLERWPSGLDAVAGCLLDGFVTTRRFPFDWQVKIRDETSRFGMYRLRARDGRPCYERVKSHVAKPRYAVWIYEDAHTARLAVPGTWLQSRLMKKGDAEVAGLAFPTGNRNRRYLLARRGADARLVLRVRLPKTKGKSALGIQCKTAQGNHSALSWHSGSQAEVALPELAPQTAGIAVALFSESTGRESNFEFPVLAPRHTQVLVNGRMVTPDGSKELAGRQDMPELLSFDGAALYLPSCSMALQDAPLPRGFVLDDEASIMVYSYFDYLRAQTLEASRLSR